MNLTEVLTVVAVVGLIAVAIAGSFSSRLGAESVRSATQDLRIAMRSARSTAVARNRAVRMELDTSGAVRVWDGRGTPAVGDDELLIERRMPSSVIFDRPDAGAAVTLTETTPGVHEVVFQSGGSVIGGIGAVHLVGGDHYSRVRVFGSGGVDVSSWDGSSWIAGKP